jgi:transposase-like protein
MSKKPRVFNREFKLMVVRRLLAGEKMSVVAQETKVLRKDLYIWRDRYRAGGAEALRGCGRPRKGEAAVAAAKTGASQRRGRRRWSLAPPASALPNWSVRSASSRSNSIFFGKPCGRSRRHVGRATGLA